MAEGLKRGDVITVAGGGPYVGKPRPAVIVQSDQFADTASVTICPLASKTTDTPLLRVAIPPDASNGLHAVSDLMIDKMQTVPRERIGRRIGRLQPTDLVRMDRALMVFLALAG